MKKWLLLIALLLSGCETKHIAQHNETNSYIDFNNGEVNCAHCSMAVNDKNYAAQLQLSDKRALFFDDIGCLLLWEQKNPNQKIATRWVYTLDSHEWIESSKAYYQGGDETPMGFGFGAYKNAPSPHIDYTLLKERF
jgi:copper chaperone NosL